MRTKAKTLELQLLGWSRSHNGGCKVTFQIHDEDLDWFESMTVRKGKIAGQIIMGALVEIGAEGEPVHPKAQQQANQQAKEGSTTVDKEPAKEPSKKHGGFADNVGPLARLAVLWCEDERFHEWLRVNYTDEWDRLTGKPEQRAKDIICSNCQVLSRKELDESEEAAYEFNRLFREPFRVHLVSIGPREA